MLVRDLITHLQRLPQDVQVAAFDNYDEHWVDVAAISVVSDYHGDSTYPEEFIAIGLG